VVPVAVRGAAPSIEVPIEHFSEHGDGAAGNDPDLEVNV
jgi:hypothetical protein